MSEWLTVGILAYIAIMLTYIFVILTDAERR